MVHKVWCMGDELTFNENFKIEEPVDEKAAEAAAQSAGVQNDAFEEAKTDEVEMSADF